MEGSDVTIVTTGMMAEIAIQAAAVMSIRGLSTRIVNIHTVKPLDRAIIKKAAVETGAIVVLEEHNIIGGLGSAVAECVSETCPCPVLRVGVRDTFGRSGKVPPLLDLYGLNAETVVAKLEAALRMKQAMKG
jgi:transketolase